MAFEQKIGCSRTYSLALFLDELVGDVGLLHVSLGDFDFFLEKGMKFGEWRNGLPFAR